MKDIPNAKDIALGDKAICAVDSKNKLHCKGGRFSGLLAGDSQRGVVSVVASGDSGCLTTTEADVYCWGTGAIRPRQGDEPYAQMNVPRDLELPGTKTLVVGANHACSLDEKNRLTCWGNNERGQVGVGEPTAKVHPKLVLEDVKQVMAAEDATCALKTSGETLCWGFAVPGSGPQKYEQMVRVPVP